MKAKYFLIIGLGVIFLGLFSQREIASHTKALLLISQEFPQIPVKPLHWFTKEPKHQQLSLDSQNGKITADLFIPSSGRKPKPAVILAMGVRTQEKDKPLLLGFADTLSRLGYIVLWPRLEILDQGEPLFEQPETFIQSFQYLEKIETVDGERISFIGFSVGSSTALIAAQDIRINNKVHGLVFFGGYYDVFDYLASLASKQAVYENEYILWEPAEGATQHTKDIFSKTNAQTLLEIFDTKTPKEAKSLLEGLPEEEKSQLKKLDPAQNLGNFKAHIFILHDKMDSYVPYAESLRLNQALTQDVKRELLITNLFEHVQPQKGVSWKIVVELLNLYGFLYKTFLFL